MKKVLKKVWRFCWKTAMWFFIVTIAWVLLYKWVNPPTTFLQLQQGWNCKGSIKGEWLDIEEIPLDMQLAVISSEDQNYLDHFGIDMHAVERATEHNKVSKKKQGASTITQQTAKNVFLWPSRTWVRKGFEVYFTWLIELIWGKERIMEVYLNVIEMGPCTFGVDGAAHKYWKKSGAKLSREQCALIAAILPSPRKSNAAKPSAYTTKRKQQILRQMSFLGHSYFKRHGKPSWPN
jgi:monofunctional glycosyltransferase